MGRKRINTELSELLLNRTFLTLATAVSLSAIYGLYALFVTPFFEPTSVRRRVEHEPAIMQGPIDKAADPASRYLSKRAAWAADAKYQLREADSVFYYTQDWERVESNDAIRLTPFAMVWFQDGINSGKQPITMVAESALVQFASKFEMTDPSPGRLVGGKLEREVLIEGPDGLSIVGRNFIFEESAMHVRSDNPVQFAYGKHRGRADGGVQIELIAAEDRTSTSALAVSGIHSVRLRRNVVMSLAMDEANSEAINVEVRCAGGFEYELETNIATFEDDVRVKRPTSVVKSDRLQCELLKLFFKPETQQPSIPTVGAIQQSGPTDSALGDPIADEQTTDNRSVSSPNSNLVFSHLLAEGERVILHSDANELTAQMTELTYDSQSKVVAMRGANNVTVWQATNEMQCPEITAIHDDDGQVTSAWCAGAGWLQHRDPDSGEIVLAARWLKQLRKYPDRKRNLEIIELQERAVVRQPGELTGIEADLIKMWFDTDATAATQRKSGADEPADKVRPRQMVALGNVALASPQLRARTRQLTAWFDRDESRVADPAMSQGRESRSRLQAVNRYVVNRQGSEVATSRRRKPKRSDEPVIVTANLIRVRVIAGLDQEPDEITDVWTEGEVHITQQNKPGEKPFHLTGDRVHLQNNNQRDQVLHVFGKPARIRDLGIDIEGNELYVDRASNLTSIEGAGRLRLPVKNDLEGNALAKPNLLNIVWQEQMTFNGQRANFYGNVHADMKDDVKDTRMRCHEMQVTLTERISFSESEEQNSEAEIRDIVCKDGVEFYSYEYLEQQQIGVRRAKFAMFALNMVTGRTGSRGPGYISVWRRGRPNRAALSLNAVASANRAVESDSADWEYTRIDFAGKTTGNLKKRHTTFHDQVQIVYGSVDQPLISIDPIDLPKDAGEMRCDKLQVSQLAETKDSPEHIEMLAQGNAQLEGNKFYARADMISYDESKGMYMLRSIGNHEATIWRQKRLGGDYSRADAQSMKFIPSRNFLDFDRATRLQGLE